MKNFKKLFC